LILSSTLPILEKTDAVTSLEDISRLSSSAEISEMPNR
jgi:hypothetical protein